MEKKSRKSAMRMKRINRTPKIRETKTMKSKWKTKREISPRTLWRLETLSWLRYLSLRLWLKRWLSILQLLRRLPSLAWILANPSPRLWHRSPLNYGTLCCAALIS